MKLLNKFITWIKDIDRSFEALNASSSSHINDLVLDVQALKETLKKGNLSFFEELGYNLTSKVEDKDIEKLSTKGLIEYRENYCWVCTVQVWNEKGLEFILIEEQDEAKRVGDVRWNVFKDENIKILANSNIVYDNKRWADNVPLDVAKHVISEANRLIEANFIRVEKDKIEARERREEILKEKQKQMQKVL